jgi:UDP-2,3-diacylglucosamine pyrophosphatase LpxH
MTSMVLDEAADALETLLADPRNTAGIFIDKANEWKAFIGGLSSTNYSRQQLEALRDKARSASGKSDMEAKLEILKAIKGDPMLGVMLIIATIPTVALRQNPFWWGLQFAEQISSTQIALSGPVDDPANYTGPSWTIKQLPAPTANRKYLIFSDIHRDSEPDYKPPFEGGATDHFLANSKLYLHCLNYAEANGFTVIEGGDCEELWFIGDRYPETSGKLDPLKKLQECFRDYKAIFDKLAALHAAGRYFRIQGNHDSFIKEPAIMDELKTRMAPGNPDSFIVYDACVIPGVKRMTDHGALSKLGILATAGASLATKAQAETDLLDSLSKGWLGMDSNDYTEKCSFLICHGHQFDFWNNPDNELLGMMIANTLGVTADQLMDPLLDAKGIALQGNPFIDFQDILASLIGFNSFPARQPSIRFAHDVQHRANSQRLVLDDIMFSETIPTLWGGLMLALNETNEDGTFVKSPSTSRAELNLVNPLDVWKYLDRHSFNHVCLGHTHNPQSQPYITLQNLAGLVPIAGGLLGKMTNLLPFNDFARLKTGYFNSGTAGWMEGVIWAIEIDATGQARLVYWVDDLAGITVSQGEPRIKPQYMDWELTPFDSTDKPKLNQAISQALGTAYQTASQPVQAVRDAMIEMIEKAQGSIADLDKMFQDFMVLPTQFLGGALMQGHDLLEDLKKLDRVYRLLEIEPWESLGLGDASDTIRQQIDGKLQTMRDFSADVLMSVKRRAMQGFPPGTQESISLKLPVPPGVDTAIKAFATGILPIIESQLKAFDPARSAQEALKTASEAANHAAALIYSVVGDFPRSMPFFSQMSDVLDPTIRARASAHPMMNTMFSTLWMYPFAGTHVDIGDKVRITSNFVLTKGLATLTVTLAKPDEAKKPTRYIRPEPNPNVS